MAKSPLLSALLQADYRFSVLIWVTLFTLPLGWQAITNTLLLAILVHSVIFLKKQDWKVGFQSRVFQVSALFVGFYLLSLWWSSNVDNGLLQLETKLTFFFGPLLIVAAKNRYIVGFRDKALMAFLFGNVLVSAAALGIAVYNTLHTGKTYMLGLDGTTHLSYFTYTTLAEPFMHPGYLSTYLGFGIFIAIYFLFKKEENSLLYAGLLSLFFVMIILLQGRINVLALFVVIGLGALLFALKKKAYKILLLPVIPVLLLVGVMIFGSASVKERYFQMPDFNYDISGDDFNSATYRLAEWKCALQVVEEHFWLGTGMGGSREALLKSYEENKFWQGIERKFNAHNQFIETTIATGICGLVLLLLLFGYYGKLALQHKDYLLLSCLVFFMLCMLTESMLERAWAVLLFTSYFPLFLSLGTKSNE